MLATQTHGQAASFGLFDTVPEDLMEFGHGDAFDAKRVTTVLGLKKADVSHLVGVSQASVRFDDAMPVAVRERMEEIAATVNLVAKVFDGDVTKTVTWFRARNPLLGDVTPRDMIRLGKYDRLRRFIINAMTSKT